MSGTERQTPARRAPPPPHARSTSATDHSIARPTASKMWSSATARAQRRMPGDWATSKCDRK
eukprot:11765418-Alexandrium_andersonii.AAC.1